MSLLVEESLAETVNNISDAFFFGERIVKEEKLKAAKFIAERQGLKGSYAGMFAPMDSDMKRIKLFTGESVASGAAIRHITGEESLRALKLLNVSGKEIKKAYNTANENMIERLKESGAYGRYCCGTCTASFWRNLVAGSLFDQEKHLEAGMKDLREYRDGSGKWRSYPYYYTLLALEEIAESGYSPKGLIDEMKYASPGLERLMKRRSVKDRFDLRRQTLAERILNRI